FASNRALDAGKQPDRPEVDVLLKIEPEAEQDAFLQHAGGHPRMADGTQEDGVHVPQLTDRALGHDLARLQITLAADVDRLERVFEALHRADLRQHLQARGDDLRPDTVPGYGPDLDQVQPLRSLRTDRSWRPPRTPVTSPGPRRRM